MLDLSPLPVLDPGVATFLSRLAERRGAFVAEVVGERATVAQVDTPGDDAAAPILDLALSAKSPLGEFILRVEARLVDHLSAVLLPGWEDEHETALPLLWRAIVAADAVFAESPVCAFEWRLGDASAKRRSKGGAVARFALAWRGTRYPLELEICSAPDEAAFQAALPDRPADISRALEIPARPSVRLGRVALRAREAASLEVGDVLLPPRAATGRLRATVAIADAFAWSGFLLESGAFEFETRLRKDQIMKDHANPEAQEDVDFAEVLEGGSEAGEGPGPTAGPDDAADNGAGDEDIGLADEELSELMVDLEARLGASSVPLSAFAKLAPGAVIDLGIDLSAPVEIIGNGRVVGAGSLIRRGDRIGVRIERWRAN